VSANWFSRTTSSYNTWALRDAGATVSRDFVLTYNIAEPAVADFSCSYDIALSGNWATLEINGTIGLVAERAFVSTYTILGSVTQDFIANYLLDGVPPTPPLPIYRDFTLLYSIDTGIETYEVYQDFLCSWKMNGVVSADFELNYFLDGVLSNPDWTEAPEDDETWSPRPSVNGAWTPATAPVTTWT
jgi:hypothetical protein